MTRKRKLVAALACRNQGARLYGKPVQNLDVSTGTRILDNIIGCLQSLPEVQNIVLGISNGVENEVFKHIAYEKGLKYIVGDEVDVLGRLIACGQTANATDIFRVTSESPFLYFEAVAEAWKTYVDADADAYFLDEVVDGCGFEIISLKALETSHARGQEKHRSELCTLYMRENHQDFKIIKATPPDELVRRDLRLTVDNPEDLALCRTVYQVFKKHAPNIPVKEIVRFLDANPDLIKLTAPFAEEGYATMYVWGER